jgi:RimJ/RimL family protein N-acetyltransferase
MANLRIRTASLELVAGTGELLNADAAGVCSLAECLGAEVPCDHWPPQLWKDAVDEFRVRTDRHPDIVGWLSWYWVLTNNSKKVLIGCGGFTGAPFNGEVMIGYSVLGPFQSKGYGTEAVRALVNWAFAHLSIHRITAETFPDNRASIRLLEKCGFEYGGKGFEKGTIRFYIPREKWLLTKT